MWMRRESEGGHQLGQSIGCRGDKVLHGCSLVSLGHNVIHSLLYGMKDTCTTCHLRHYYAVGLCYNYSTSYIEKQTEQNKIIM